jgi:gas vesicle protein
MSSRNRWAEIASAFAIGAGIGAAIGILFAPKSGEDTREFIRSSARDAVDSALAQGQDWTRRAQEKVEKVRGSIQDAADEGQQAYRQAKNASS